jgi:two-component system, NarL family, response regulator DevR
VENSTESQYGLRAPENFAQTGGSPVSAIKILLVNDELLVLEGLRLILRSYPEFSVVATAHDSPSTLQQIYLHRPHIVLMGLGPHTAGTDGIEATRIISRHHAHIKIVILASSQQQFYMREAFLAGAHGYLSKNIDQGELRASLRAVHREGAVLPPDMARQMLRMISGRPPIDGDPLPGLNERERQIVFMMTRGHDTNDIATSLGLSPKTIRNYFSRIYAKLGTENRLQTALYASGSFARSARSQEPEHGSIGEMAMRGVFG